MKLGYLLALPLAFSFCYSNAARAEDHDEKVEIKEKNNHGDHEWKMKIKKHDSDYVGVYNDREYKLRGNFDNNFHEGEYVVHGDMATDGTYIQTRDFKPVVVERQEERPVIIEKKEPLIKLPGVEINKP